MNRRDYCSTTLTRAPTGNARSQIEGRFSQAGCKMRFGEIREDSRLFLCGKRQGIYKGERIMLFATPGKSRWGRHYPLHARFYYPPRKTGRCFIVEVKGANHRCPGWLAADPQLFQEGPQRLFEAIHRRYDDILNVRPCLLW